MKQKLRFDLAEMKMPRVLLSVLFMLICGGLKAQQSISVLGTATTQNFDAIGSSATASLPAAFRFNTAANWSTGTTATTQAAGTSGTGVVTSSSAGGAYNWANGITASSTDRAIGFLTSSGFASPRTIIYAFTNNTGSVVNSVDLSFAFEKYRSGTRQFDWTFTHGSTATSIATAASAGNQSYPADANNTVVSNPPLSVAKNFTLSGLSIANGTTYYLCWTYTGLGGSTNSQGLGLDDFSITLNSIQNPTTTSISPSSATAGDLGFTITVDGTNFISGLSAVTWNGSSRTTTFVSATQLTATINAADIASPGSANVGVTTTGAASVSNTQTFTINAPATPNLSVSGTTAHGSSCPAIAATPIQYTITNTGLATANGISVVSDNPEFVVSGLSATTIAGSGGTATYFVTFTPASAGAKTATVTVSSSTSGSNSPTSSLTGTGTTSVTAVVTSSAATAINNTVATLNGNVGTLGVCPNTTEKGFVYSQTSVNADPLNGGTGVTKTPVAGLSTGNFNLPLSSLSAATSYSFKAYVFDGTNYTYGTVQTFSTLAAADHLALVSVPAAGNVGVALSTFTVEARRPDNSVDTNYTGSVTINKASGPGGLGGTLTVSAASGIASFSTATFDSAGTYTITAASGSLTSITSGNIDITLAPVSIFANTITGTNPSSANPYTTGQTFDSHLTVSGIGRGSGITAASANDRYSASAWTTGALDATDYFEFTLTPSAGYQVSFTDFTYTGTASGTGPTAVTLRSSLDGFVSNIGSPTIGGTTISLASIQNVQSAITFRFYAHNAAAGTGTFSVNDFTFRGNVLCMQPTAFNVTGGGSTCNPAGLPVGLSNSQTGVNYQLKRDGNNVGAAVAGTGSALAFGNQAVAGTYTVEATNTLGGCNTTVAMSGNAVLTFTTATTWTGAVDSDWNNAGNWSCGVVPTASSDVLIASGSPQITANAFANTLTIQSGALLTVLSGRDLTVTGAITTTGGNFTIENNANLIQVDNVANTGLAKVKRNSSALMRQDYTLWSSPVSGQNLLPFSPQTLTSRFYTYNTDTNLYNTVADPNTTEFASGTGYLIRMPNNHPTTPTVWAGEFNGTLHNGNISVPLANSGAGLRFNLIGNPYASPISMQAFVTDNASDITGTLYFWRKTNNTASPSYCTWSSALGFVSNGEAQVVDPQGIIRTGQGFLVEASAAGTQVVFNNAQRSGDNADQFFRSANEVEVHRVWLNATNASGAFSQTLVGYVTNATLADDAHIDGKFFNDGDIAFYSLIGADKFAIQGRPLPFADTDVVPMGFKTANAGNYSIAIDHMDGLFSEGQNVYLRDNSTNTVHDLNSGAYSFASEAGTFNDRFEVIYQNALGVYNPSLSGNAVIVYKQDGQFVINSGNSTMSAIKVYDALGKVIKEVGNIDASETRISTVDAHQMLIFKIQDTDGRETVKKVMN